MLLQRAITAAVLVPLVILLILLPATGVFAVIVAGAFLLAAWEWLRLSGVQQPLWRIIGLLVAALVFMLLWQLQGTFWTPLLLAAGVAWWLLASLWLRHFAYAAAPTGENRAIKLLAGVWVVFPAWIGAVSLHAQVPHGRGWTLLALVIVWVADIGAYFSGRRFGKRKLAPQISPGKTWAGVYGALLAGVVATLLGGWWLGVRGPTLVALAILGAMTVAASIVGDLLESLMKRHAGVKDSGTLIPGHGGLMDRLDSVFAALPVFAAGVIWLGLWK